MLMSESWSYWAISSENTSVASVSGMMISGSVSPRSLQSELDVPGIGPGDSSKDDLTLGAANASV